MLISALLLRTTSPKDLQKNTIDSLTGALLVDEASSSASNQPFHSVQIECVEKDEIERSCVL